MRAGEDDVEVLGALLERSGEFWGLRMRGDERGRKGL